MIFVRPEWLWLLLLLIPATYIWLRYAAPKTNWQHVIQADLLQAIAGNLIRSSRQQSWLLPTLIALTIIAIAGPALTTGKVQTATQGNLVVILDNSLSMAATDIAPNRITRAKRMITDWSQSGLFSESAVIVYSGSAHWLTPFTRDAKTLEVQLAPIDPFIMPALGNQPELAFDLLKERLQTLPDTQLNILWLTDDINTTQVEKIGSLLPPKANKYLAIIGTEQGSAIPLPNNNGFLTDGDNMVIVKVDGQQLYSYGQKLGFTALTLGDQPTPDLLSQGIDHKSAIVNSQEVGYWLIIPIILLFIWLMKNQTHLLFVFVCLILISAPNESYAFELKQLFLNQDQQAKHLLDQEEYQKALDVAKSADLKGHAAFELGDFERAAEEFKGINTATGFYNYGNSLVQQGKLQEAIDAYEQALTLADHVNARKNKKIIEDYLQQQENTSNDQKNNNRQDNNTESTDNNDQKSEPQQNQGSPKDPTDQNQDDALESNDEGNENSQENEVPEPETQTQTQKSDEPALTPEELRQQQQIESVLNQLQSTPGYVTQHKFRYQFQQNPTQETGTSW